MADRPDLNLAPNLFDADEVMENADEWWKDCAGRALAWWAESGQNFTAADVIALGMPEADSNGRMGALFRAACARGEIEPVGYQPSTQPSRHGSVVRVWRGRRAA